MPEPDAAIDQQQSPSPIPENLTNQGVEGDAGAPAAPAAPVSAIQGSIDKGQVTNDAPNPAAVAHVSRLAQLGHVASKLLGNEGGQQKPGDLFRHLVAGALLGGMAGAGSRNVGEGIGRGGGTVVARNDQQAEIARKQKQQTFENQQKLRTENREDTLTSAQIAHMHVQDLHADSQMDLMQQEHLDKINDYNDKMDAAATEIGGSHSQIMFNGKDINGQVGNGTAIRKAYTANPRAFDAPQGYYRIHSQKVDYSGLKYKAGTGWVDEAGNQVDMSDRTTHQFYDISQNDMNKPITKTGKEINDLAGFKAFDDDKPHTLTLGQLMGLKTQSTKNALEQNKAGLERQQLQLEIQKTKLEAEKIKTEIDRGNKADMVSAYETNKVLMDGAKARLRDAANEMDPEEKKQAIADMDEAAQNMKQIQEKLYPKTASPKTTPTPPDIAALQSQVKWDTLGPNEAAVYDPKLKKPVILPADKVAQAVSRGGIAISRPSAAAKQKTVNDVPQNSSNRQLFIDYKAAKDSVPQKVGTSVENRNGQNVPVTIYNIPGQGQKSVTKSEEAGFLKSYQDKLSSAEQAILNYKAD